ncbi:MAG: DUF192 domain-containing protein [Nanoarchaeota archaeon]|nr:DUF192 domain-containing protein [Nanoarchaeota archaeon]MCG2718379.1 DUF192 domain-containing protein [Nanoarchaeota archaeon]
MEILHNNVILADNVKYCTDIFSRSKGLRFAKPLRKGQAIILVASEESTMETTIDMFFVFFPIDVLWLNKEKEVIDIKRNVKPFMPIVIPRRPAKYVVELKKGVTNNIQLGDKLRF